MRGSSDSDERGWDVVHDYVGCLPDDAAAPVVGGVKIPCGFGRSCSVSVGEGPGVVWYWLSEVGVGAWGDVACVGRCISAECCTL